MSGYHRLWRYFQLRPSWYNATSCGPSVHLPAFAAADLRFITNSNVVGRSAGRSAGFAPVRVSVR